MKTMGLRIAAASMLAAITIATPVGFDSPVASIAAAAPGAAEAGAVAVAGADGGASVGAAAAAAAPDSAAARAAFERLKALAGEWKGRSTKGWEDETTYRVIAGGSVVMATSFDAHPGETMATMFYMDGDRLRLVHYCVAGNQPLLVATRISGDARNLTFTFEGGGNLPTRDLGHMDQAEFRLIDADVMTSRWTWYQDGQERWMEEIEYQRVR